MIKIRRENTKTGAEESECILHNGDEGMAKQTPRKIRRDGGEMSYHYLSSSMKATNMNYLRWKLEGQGSIGSS